VRPDVVSAGRTRIKPHFPAWVRHLLTESTWHGRRKKEKISMADSVKLYTLSTCGHCKSTKTFLNECKVKYDFTDVDLFQGDERAAILEDVKKWNPSCSFPTIIIGDTVIVGYREDEIKEALGL
jgi:glutaredoxin-like protein NrdH